MERAAPVPDNPEALHQALKDSLDAGRHLTIFCAGSSAGSKDFTRATLEKEGEILTHGIAAMPASRPCSPTAGAASWPGRRGIR